MTEAIIRVIDLETTGFDPDDDAVVEVAWCDVTLRPDLLDGWADPQVRSGMGWLIDPKRPIPPIASSIHHITDEDVAGRPAWPDFLTAHREAFETSADGPLLAYAAHNAKFEAAFCRELTPAAPWICTYKCALRLWPDAPSHSNQALRYFVRPEGLDRSVADRAHRAYPDAYVTAFHLREMLRMDGVTVEQMVRWSTEPALQITCHIGKNRGRKWTDVDTGFLYWLIDKDFDEDVLFTARHELERREKEAEAQYACGEPA